MRSDNNYQHLVYGVILTFIVIGFLFLGNYYSDNLEDDYNSKIALLKENISQLQSELGNKQKQIETLSFKVIKSDEQIKEIGQQIKEENKQYKLQIGELNQRLTDLFVESESFSEIIPNVIDSVVSVLTDSGQGSGAIISSEGHVVTNYHIIEKATKASILTYDGKLHGVELIGFDVENDLAVLKITTNKNFDYFEFGDSSELKIGQKIVALGNPAGLSFTATEGIVSSTSRLANDGLYYIQTDATLNPGNSGGPLINAQGKIIGIVDFKISGFEALGFAIPSNRAKEVLEPIIG